MNIIRELEEELNDWKALMVSQTDKKGRMYQHYKSGVGALVTAIDRINRPSNTAMQIDTKAIQPCPECFDDMTHGKFCSECGRPLSK